MPQVHRLGDPNDEDGIITDIPQGTVFANELLVSIDGSLVEGGPTVTANGSPTVFIGGIPVNRLGDEDSDGTPRAQGSPNVYVNDGDATGKAATTATATAESDNAGAGSTSPPSPVITPPNISSAATAAANAAVISTVLENAVIAAPAAGLPFDRPEGLKRITLTATASATAAVGDKIIQTVINSGVIPAAPPSLPFGGTPPPVVATASARMFASLASDNATPEVSNAAMAAVEAWYKQKITGLAPAIKEEILPFNNDLSSNKVSTPISNIVVNQVAGDNLPSAELVAIGEAWYTQKIIEVMTKDGKLPKEKIFPFGGDDA
jgi:uncharacterized Zn-binding protein involved in type VI secretion